MLCNRMQTPPESMLSPRRATALQRLDVFLPFAGRRYAERRNFDLGPGDRHNVSCLSPWLRHRVLLEDEVLKAVVEAHGPDAAGKFIDEVFWRTYFRGWMAQHPDCWRGYQAEVLRGLEQREKDRGLDQRLADAEAGRTGNPAFDTWAQELVATGYLHNHARMWFASLWVFTLRLPWALGADFFLRHLLDGDPASNTLGWRWVAGLHTRGKIYLARRDNILRFTEGRLDPGDALAREALPMQEAEAPVRHGLCWPEPPRRDQRNGWLLTPEDCRAEPGRFLASEPVMAVTATAGRSPGPVADAVLDFSRGCVLDALERRGRSNAPMSEAADHGAIRDWALKEGLDTLHVMHVPYGPIAEQLGVLERVLAEAGIALQRHTRAHDRAAWPYADRGFFKLRKRIPRLLEGAQEGQAPDA